jgi:hypothetical protein
MVVGSMSRRMTHGIHMSSMEKVHAVEVRQ